MSALQSADLVRIWEQGWGRGPIGRTLTILGAALPERSPDQLADLSLGARDAALLRLRQQLFGPALAGYAECPQCGERLEYSLDTGALLGTAPAAGPPPALVVGAVTVHYRLPTTRDLAAAAACSSVDGARRGLVQRCVWQAGQGGELLAPDQLPESVVSALAVQLALADPQAEILLDLACPACSHAWQHLFDIASFLWLEIAAAVRSLLAEVATLARTYGWSEADILAMSPLRRQFYLDL